MQKSTNSQPGFSLSRMFRFQAIGQIFAAFCLLLASSAWAIVPSFTTDIAGNNLTGVPYDLGQTYIYAPPSLASVTPTSGAQGATVASFAIVGTNTNFAQGTSVLTFSGTGITVNSLTVIDGTHATANITLSGSAATTARDVTVTTSSEVAVLTAGFTVVVPVPTVTSLATTSGPTAGGTSVIITGTAFTGTTAVKFGATNATGFTVNSATQITATAPAGTGTVDVTVTTTGGTSATGAGDQFTFVAAPTVTSLATTSGPTAGGTSVVVTGTNFSGATAVKFGSTNATGFTVNSATQITATAPAGSAGTVDVTVTTVGGTSAASAADQFTYVALPTVTSINTSSGPTAGGTTVVITGTNLSAATGVKFGATAATGLTANTATSITATSPAGTGTVDVTVTTAGGTSATSAADQFTYVALPTITSISPTSGSTAGGTVVVITGTNLTGATGVTIGGTAATLGTNTGTTLSVTTGAHAAGTGLSVLVTTPAGTNAANTLYSYAVPADIGTTFTGGNLTLDGSNSSGPTYLNFSVDGSGYLLIHDSAIPPRSLGSGPGIIPVDSSTIKVLLSSITSLNITGTPFADTFNLDFTNDLPANISVNGGLPTLSPGDEMIIANTPLGEDGVYGPTGAGMGTISLTGGSGTNTISFTGLEPVDMSGAPLHNFTINIDPSNVLTTNITTTVASADAGVNTLISFDNGLESVKLGTVTGTLTINGSDNTTGGANDHTKGNDYLVLNSLGTAMVADFVVDGKGGDADVIDINNTSFTVAGVGNNLSLKADFIGIGRLDAAPGSDQPGVINCSGNITLEANGDSSVVMPLWNVTGPPAVTGVWGAQPSYLLSGSSIPANVYRGTIQLRGDILKTAGSDATLTLKATGTVTMPSGATGTNLTGRVISSNNKLNVLVQTDTDSLNGGSVLLMHHATITTNGGNLTMGGGANPLTSPAVGTTDITTTAGGIVLQSSNISTGGGNISLRGQGANRTSGHGVAINVFNGSVDSVLDSGSGNLTINGTTGTGSANTMVGVLMNANTLNSVHVKTTTGSININGTSQSTGTSLTSGFHIQTNADIKASSTGNITITGSTAAAYAAAVADINITVTSPSTVAITSAGGNVSFIGDTMNLAGGTGTKTFSTSGSGLFTLKQRSNGKNIDLGATDTASLLGLSTTELGLITASTLQIGDSSSGTINISAALNPTTYTTLALANNTTFAATGGFTSTLSGATNFTNIALTGTLSINTSATLSFASGGGFVPSAGQDFRIITNDGSDAISGNFSALAEGASIANFLTSGITEGVTYVGGTGNDLVIGVAPTISASTGAVLINSTTLIITGTGFDSTTPSNNVVTLSNGATGVVTAATPTQLTVTLSTPAIGSLTAVVNNGISSGAPVQVATIVPVITPSTANLAATASSISISGLGFDPTPINDGVTFSGATSGTRTPTAASATGLSVNLPSPVIAGILNASMTSNGVSSGTPVQVATITPVVTSSTTSLAANATTVTINGFGFDPTAANNAVTFNDGAVGTVTSASNTALTVTFGTTPTSAGTLTAVVTTNSVSSGSAVQVATVIPVVTSSTANIQTTDTTVSINGFGFDASNANNSVTFNLGATGSVTTSSPTHLVVTFGTKPTLGNLTAVVSSNTQSSGSAVQVATVANIGINPTTLPNWTVNKSGYLQTLAGTNGTSPYTFLVTAGALPTGLTLGNLTGVISGTPTTAGTFNFTVTTTDNLSASGSQAYTIVINSAVSVSPSTLPAWTVNKSGYTQTVTSSGGTGAKTLSISSGAIPTGMTFTAGTGALSGTPTTAGTFNFTVTATDTVGAFGSQAYTVVVNGAVSVSPSTLPNWTANKSGYTQTVTSSGGTGTKTLSITFGAVPTGMTFTAGTGAISGTPTAAGTFNFTVTATDTVGATGSQAYTVVINSAVSVSPSTLPNWTVNTSGYSQTLSSSGGTGAISFSVSSGALPTGLSLASGVISGTPTTAGTFNFTVTGTDTVGAIGSQAYTVVINSAVSVSPSTLPNWTVNKSGYTQTVTSSGGTGSKSLSITAGAIPTGMTFTAGTGVLSGTPTAAGTFNFTVTAMDSVGATGAQAYSVVVNPAISYGALSVTTWTVNQSGYSGTVAVSGGTGAYSGLNVTGLPTGLSAGIAGSTITISGTPTAAASTPNNVSITLNDSVGASTTQTFTLTVNTLTITANTASLAQNATQLIINGTGFSTTLLNNSVTLSSGTATVTAATATQLTCSLVGPLTLGTLNATATVVGNGSTSATQVATVVAAPTVTLATTSNPITATTVTITGTGFDSSAPGNNTVTLNDGATGTVTSATATSLTVTFGTKPTAVGSLTAVVTSFGGSSGSAKQIATVSPVVTSSSSNLSVDANTLLINGFGFDTTAANNTVSFSNGATGTVTSATGTQLTVTFGTHATSLGSMTASVTTDSVSSGTAVQVATVIAGAATHFSVTAPGTATAGVAINTTVTALDQFNNTAISYTGTVHFTKTDNGSGSAVPVNYTFVSGDSGVHIFTGGVTLVTVGSKTVTATDTVTGTINGTSGNIVVGAAAASQLVVTAPGTATAGVAINSTVTALDAFGNTATGYLGTVHFTKTDAGVGSAVPANYTFVAGDSGVHTFTGGVTLVTAGSKTVTATDTVTGSINGTSGNIVVGAAAATHFAVTAPGTATAGVAINTTVTALDQFGNTATGYLGTVHFTKTDANASALVPVNYTFVAGDSGVHVFTGGITLATVGTQTVTATDTVTGSITGTSGNIVVSAAAATHFAVTAPGTATAGAAFNTTVTALDQFGNTATGYLGTVHFTKSDAGAGSAVPVNYTFVAGDSGAHTFSAGVTLVTVGSKTVTATDTVTGSINGTSSNIVVSPAAASQLVVSAPGTATAGVAINTTVTALDQFGNTATGYLGTVHFTKTDSGSGSAVPANYTFVAGDNGVHAFTGGVTLVTVGSKAVTATDTVTGSITGTSGNIVVGAAAASQLVVSAPGTATAGVAFNTIVTALDQFGNTATGYLGTVHFTTSDSGASASVPVNYTFVAGDSGVHTFTGGVKLVTVGTQTVTATDTVSGSITGTSGNIVVSPAAATHFTVTAPGTATAGVAISSTVTALDQFNNTATGYTGTIHFTTSDSGASTALPANYTFVSGDSGVHTFANAVTLVTSGTQTVTATDTVSGTINGTTANITVSAAAASQLIVTAPGTATAGVAINTSVTAKDQYGNTAVSYTGTVHFTKTDSAVLSAVPANYTFVSGDNGVHIFTNGVTLVTAGNQTVTATDTVTGSINGTSGTIAVGAAAATQLIVSAPGTTTAGVLFSSTVTALDQFGNTATGYRGIVHFTKTDSGALASVPVNYTFTSGDSGVHTFASGVKLVTAGNQTVTATDTVTSSITGTTATIAVSAAAASHLAVSAAGTATAGVAINSSVTALDAFGNTAITYTGTVHFTSSDAGASVVLPVNYTFVPGDNGVHVFSGALTFVTAGTQTLTATDTISGSINGTSSGTIVSAAAATHLAVTAPGTATAGVAIDTTVTAQDQFGNTATTYLGTVHFTKTDANGSSQVPANYSFVAGDNGVHTFTGGVTLVTAGSQTVTATDTVTGTITGTSGNIAVNPAATSHFVVTGPSLAGPGTPVSITVTTEDAFNNITTAYTGTVAFTLTDSGAGVAVPANYTFVSGDAGVHTFTNGVTFATPGQQTLTATDTVSSSVKGSAILNVGTLDPTPTQLVPTNPVTGLPLPPGSLYPVISQSGTLEVRVSIKNTTAFSINGFRLSVDYSAYLPFHSLVLYNRTSPSNYSEPAHIDYIDYPYPVAVGDTVSLKLQFYTTTRTLPNPFSPTLTVTKLAASAVSSTDGSGVQPRIKMLPTNNILLEWDSTVGQWYRIKYSSDLINWYDCPVPVPGAANRTQWVDDGPPFTNVPPSAVGARYYKLNAISAPTGP